MAQVVHATGESVAGPVKEGILTHDWLITNSISEGRLRLSISRGLASPEVNSSLSVIVICYRLGTIKN